MDKEQIEQMTTALGQLSMGQRCAVCDALLVHNGTVINGHGIRIFGENGTVLRVCNDCLQRPALTDLGLALIEADPVMGNKGNA